jgi:hypothetical protein
MWTRAVFATLALLTVSFILTACDVPVSGFKPIYPQLTITGDITRAPDILEWTVVDSLQPTLRWEPFPGTHQANANAQIKPFVVVDQNSVRDVTYELRIWTVSNNAPAEVAYERAALMEPFHRLEQSLKPSTQYYWSVRARFSLNGQPRVTEWSLSSIPCLPRYLPECARGIARETGMIPSLNYYRFKTPRTAVFEPKPVIVERANEAGTAPCFPHSNQRTIDLDASDHS